MNDQNNSVDLQRKKSRLPKLTIGWTILVAALIAFLHSQSFWLNEQFNMNPAIPWLASMLLIVITIMVWACWSFFFAKLRLVGLLIFILPVAFLTLFQINVLGDANFGGFKPRFWDREANFVETIDEETKVDLLSTTEFDFPQFLGRDRNAKVSSVNLADDWLTPPKQLWKIDVGDAWSGFAIVNGFAVTQEQRGEEECVTCYDVKTGELKWISRFKRRHEDTMAMGKVGPRATPTIHDGLIYAMSATGVLDCLDGASGGIIWCADIPELVQIEQVESKNSIGYTYTEEASTIAWGRSSSPLIVDDAVVVPAGGPTNAKDLTNDPTATLIAFDKKNGLEKWRGGKRMVAYGSPSLATVAGTRQILLVGESAAVGHDATTGEELWAHQWLGNSNGDANCSQVTPVNEDQLILSKGYNKGGELIEVTNDNGAWSIESIHKSPRVLKTKFNSPVIHQGHAYSLSDGFLECTEVESFKRKWKQRGRFGNGQLLLVGDKLLVHTEFGQLFLISANPAEYSELASINTIKGICWNTIALYGDLLLVRSELEAACYQLPTESE